MPAPARSSLLASRSRSSVQQVVELPGLRHDAVGGRTVRRDLCPCPALLGTPAAEAPRGGCVPGEADHADTASAVSGCIAAARVIVMSPLTVRAFRSTNGPSPS